jgi:hypothetical protein
MYQWWCIYAPALDMFFESSLTRGTYPRQLLDRNLAKLKATAQLARRWGLMPTFVGFEPRAWPERLYDRYPDLRGARVDCSDYSVEAEFAPDPNHPQVLEHYREMMTNLMREVPDLGLFSVWSQDSAAGFPWAKVLYPGANGPRPPRRKPIEETVARFMSTLRDAGRAVNPKLQLTLCLSWFKEDEIRAIAAAMPRDIDFSYTVGWNGDRPKSGRREWHTVTHLRSVGREPQVQLEEVANPWKPLGPILGVPFPFLAYDTLCDAVKAGQVKDLILRGGIQTEVFVPNYINNEVIRAFQFEGPALDVEALVRHRAQAWTQSAAEASALVEAWRLADAAVRAYRVLAWTVTFVSGRTLWRRLVRPLVPNQKLLSFEDWNYYRSLEFNVGPSDPAWFDHFYKGYGRMVRDDVAWESLRNYEQNILPSLQKAVALLNGCGRLSPTARDVRDRIGTLFHALWTERNLLEVQEAIHACLAENQQHPETSAHRRRIRAAMDRELDNTRRFIELVESSPSVLIPTTSGVETTYMLKAPLAHQFRRKLIAMQRHLDDPPGPWFEELKQPGGWTSDLRDKLPPVS